jgi:hypothetical protein
MPSTENDYRQLTFYVVLVFWDKRGTPALYAVTVRGRKRIRQRPLLDTWYYPLALGQQLPTLPICLDVDLGVLLDLETSYEETCRVLHIS